MSVFTYHQVTKTVGISARCILRLSFNEVVDQDTILKDLLKARIQMECGYYLVANMSLGLNLILSKIPEFFGRKEVKNIQSLAYTGTDGEEFGYIDFSELELIPIYHGSTRPRPDNTIWHIDIPLVYDYFFGDYIDLRRFVYHTVKFILLPSSEPPGIVEIIPELIHTGDEQEDISCYIEPILCCIRYNRYEICNASYIMIFYSSDKEEMAELTSVHCSAGHINIEQQVDHYVASLHLRLYILSIAMTERLRVSVSWSGSPPSFPQPDYTYETLTCTFSEMPNDIEIYGLAAEEMICLAGMTGRCSSRHVDSYIAINIAT